MLVLPEQINSANIAIESETRAEMKQRGRNYTLSMFVLLATAQSWALPDVHLPPCLRCFGVFCPEPLGRASA